jgi:hypothetical protein
MSVLGWVMCWVDVVGMQKAKRVVIGPIYSTLSTHFSSLLLSYPCRYETMDCRGCCVMSVSIAQDALLYYCTVL